MRGQRRNTGITGTAAAGLAGLAVLALGACSSGSPSTTTQVNHTSAATASAAATPSGPSVEASAPLSGGGGSAGPSGPASVTGTGQSGTPGPTPSGTTPTPTTSASPRPSGPPLLRQGDRGPRVQAAQRRLLALGYWLSEADGTYGPTTSQAVFALQKAAGLGRDGVLGPRTQAALDRGVRPSATSRSGHVVEIDKARQLMLFVDDGKVGAILNTSTGTEGPYVYKGQTYLADTPKGRFKIFRQVDALDTGPLGDLWRPKYFNGGIALHGSAYIPGYPASHGCARLSNAAIDWIWATNRAPVGTSVWVY